jgi:MerR family mercuric resistance operon transcriptional regulator
MNTKTNYTIGEIAEIVNVSVETIRFYERKKILIQPPKSLGRRKYNADHINHLNFIRQAQKVGFSLQEIKELINLKLNPNRSCLEIKKKTGIKIEEVSR